VEALNRSNFFSMLESETKTHHLIFSWRGSAGIDTIANVFVNRGVRRVRSDARRFPRRFQRVKLLYSGKPSETVDQSARGTWGFSVRTSISELPEFALVLWRYDATADRPSLQCPRSRKSDICTEQLDTDPDRLPWWAHPKERKTNILNFKQL
jgi:hypothetical protein